MAVKAMTERTSDNSPYRPTIEAQAWGATFSSEMTGTFPGSSFYQYQC